MVLLTRRAIARPRPTKDLCVRCNYDLTDLWYELPRCPECGSSQYGHASVRADAPMAQRLNTIGSWAMVWWIMVTLAAIGIAWTIGMTILAGYLSI